MNLLFKIKFNRTQTGVNIYEYKSVEALSYTEYLPEHQMLERLKQDFKGNEIGEPFMIRLCYREYMYMHTHNTHTHEKNSLKMMNVGKT